MKIIENKQKKNKTTKIKIKNNIAKNFDVVDATQIDKKKTKEKIISRNTLSQQLSTISQIEKI